MTNGTTGKPVAGERGTLLSLSQGMQEVGTTKTDAQGKFSMAAPIDQGAPHMVRVTHGGVNYFPQGGPLMPGATTPRSPCTTRRRNSMAFRRQSRSIASRPTVASCRESHCSRSTMRQSAAHARCDKTFELVLAAGGRRFRHGEGSPWATTEHVFHRNRQKGHYAFSFPLRPGETVPSELSLAIQREASFTPKPLTDVQHFVVMTPKGMTVTEDVQRLQSMPDNSGAGIMVATRCQPGEDLSFKVAGADTSARRRAAERG